MVRPFASPTLGKRCARRPVATVAIALVVAFLYISPRVHGETSVLVATGSTWRYLDNGSDQGSAWRMPTFDDTGWPNGPAQLGYGDGDEATVVGYGGNPAAKNITPYFRRSFSVSNPLQFSSLNLRVLRVRLHPLLGAVATSSEKNYKKREL